MDIKNFDKKNFLFLTKYYYLHLMIEINSYLNVSYNAFQKEMDSYFEKSQLKELEIALSVGLKSIATVKNSFRKDSQIVSDEVMSKIMKLIGIDGFILWMCGIRYYYIKK